MSERSLRQLLLRGLVVPLVAMVALATLLDYHFSIRPGLEADDRALKNAALAVARHVLGNPGDAALPPVAERLLAAGRHDRVYYQVSGPQGEPVAGSHALGAPPPDLRENQVVLQDGRVGNARVRIAAIAVPTARGPMVIQVAETARERLLLLQGVLADIVLPDVIFGAVLVAFIWVGVGRALSPLRTLSIELAARSPSDLRPLPEGTAPAEVRPLVRAMNELLQRLREASDSQRRFLANAAHQLRTPLAALGTQAELARRSLAAAELPAIIDHLVRDAARATRMLNQLLTLARAEPHGLPKHDTRRVDLKQLVENAAEVWVPRALHKDIDLGFEAQAAALQGDPLLIEQLLDNLIDNAIRYTAVGGTVTVRCFLHGEHAVVQVEDNGIGIPEQERARVLERFYRSPGSPSDGSGLGLAIVQEIADAHRALIDIEAGAAGGTRVSVRFPSAKALLDPTLAPPSAEPSSGPVRRWAVSLRPGIRVPAAPAGRSAREQGRR